MGTTRAGHNVAIRIMAVGEDGKTQLQILRKVARGDISLFSDNHVAPLWGEVAIGDLSFAVFPSIGYKLRHCYGAWAKNSVGDIVDMIMQTLEVSVTRLLYVLIDLLNRNIWQALAFIHDLGIAHRVCQRLHLLSHQSNSCSQDSEKDNFLVQWHPESLATMQVPICRPRVFMIDLEVAYEFPPDTPEECRRLVGPPWEDYQRDTAPEVAIGPYDPFKADVWQLAHSFSDFKVSTAATGVHMT